MERPLNNLSFLEGLRTPKENRDNLAEGTTISGKHWKHRIKFQIMVLTINPSQYVLADSLAPDFRLPRLAFCLSFYGKTGL